MLTPRLRKIRTIMNWAECIGRNDPWQSGRNRAAYYGVDICRRLMSGNYVACRKLTRREDEKFVRVIHEFLSEGGTLQQFAP